MIDGQHLGALAREHQRRGAAVAHAFAGALSGADDDGDLALQAASRYSILFSWHSRVEGRNAHPGAGSAAEPLRERNAISA